MKLLISLASVALLVFGSAPAQEQTPPGPDEEARMMQEMMAKWQEIATPGEMHTRLSALEGVWDTESRIMMGEDPQISRGTAEYLWIMGGRYLRQDFRGEMMGRPMNGMSLTGYDNHAKKYVGIWIDDAGTGIATMDGHMNQDGSVLTMFGKMDEWTTGEIGKTVKYVTRILDQDKHVFEIHDMAIGEPNTKVMEITYTRRKP